MSIDDEHPPVHGRCAQQAIKDKNILISANFARRVKTRPVMDHYPHIADFISGQTAATVCCRNAEGELHCFNAYYAFDKDRTFLYFKTSEETKHMAWLAQHAVVAGTILPDKLNKLQVKGIQFTGRLLPADDAAASHAQKHYYLKYPFALAMPGSVRTIAIHQMKMTDNSLGFGTKLEWAQDPNVGKD
jgi:uncharacterized protein YhbP (UPF0306 family)